MTDTMNPFLNTAYEMAESLYECFKPTNGEDRAAHESFERLLADKVRWADGRAEHEKIYGTDLGAAVNTRLEQAEAKVKHLSANRSVANAKDALWSVITAWRSTYPLPEGTKADDQIMHNQDDAYGWALMEELTEEVCALLPALAQLAVESDTAYDHLGDTPDDNAPPPPQELDLRAEIESWGPTDEFDTPTPVPVTTDDLDEDFDFLKGFGAK